jgi:hypothetical protein
MTTRIIKDVASYERRHAFVEPEMTLRYIKKREKDYDFYEVIMVHNNETGEDTELGEIYYIKKDEFLYCWIPDKFKGNDIPLPDVGNILYLFRLNDVYYDDEGVFHRGDSTRFQVVDAISNKAFKIKKLTVKNIQT